MNQNESSLLGFLQSRSLFSQQLRRSNSINKSIKSRDSPRLQSPSNNTHAGVVVQQNDNYNQSWASSLQSSLLRNNDGLSNMGNSNGPSYPMQSSQQDNNGWNRPLNSMQNQPPQSYQMQQTYQIPQKNPQFFYKSNTKSFETAHMQSFRCLDNVSNKISIRLTEVNQKIDRFNHKIKAWITQELHFAYQSIITILDNAFKQQEILIRAYVQKVEQSYNASIAKTKATLQAEYRRVDQLKQHLKGPDWRKATGEILTSQLQSKIDTFISQTYQEQQAQWIPRSYVREHLKSIEMQVYEILKLRTFAVL